MAARAPQASHFGLILPLCSSSAIMGLALYQYPVFGSFLNDHTLAGKTLSRYWEPVLKQGYVVITGLGLTSTIAGVLSARWLTTHQTLETSDVSSLYTYGAVLSAAHFAFLPLVMRPIRKMIDRGSGAGSATVSDESASEGNKEDMKTWFLWHTIRTFAVDLPALYCFAEGAARSFWISNA